MNDAIGHNKKLNEIYKMIYQKKESSRQEIAKELDLSLPTVTQNINQLRECGLIYDAGNFESTGGRKPTILSCVPSVKYAMGVDITRNHINVVLIDLELTVIDSIRIRIHCEETEEYLSELINLIETMIDRNIKYHEKLLGIGMSLPVIVEDDHESISYATVIPISNSFIQKVKESLDYPVKIFNDANSGGLAESWRANYERPMIYLSLSGSVGGAFIDRMSIYNGDNCRGCEVGHMTVVPNGKTCYCGQRGCLDAYCSSKELSSFTDGNLGRFFVELKTNEGFQKLFDEYLDVLAIAVNNLEMCFDCDVVLGGYVGPYLEEYLPLLKKKVSMRNPFVKDASYLRVCHYKVAASAVGAGIYFIEKYFDEF